VQQEILDRNPGARVRVYAVWFNMLWLDSRGRWDGAGLTDTRVVHLWDERKTIGAWYAARVAGGGGPAWDFYALYGPDARWERDGPRPLDWGGTVVRRGRQLREGLAPLIGAPALAEPGPGLPSTSIRQRANGAVPAHQVYVRQG
jgi:hypothetical protein